MSLTMRRLGPLKPLVGHLPLESIHLNGADGNKHLWFLYISCAPGFLLLASCSRSLISLCLAMFATARHDGHSGMLLTAGNL